MAEPNIIMYIAPRCGACCAAVEYLNTKGVKYKAYNVTTNKEAREEMERKRGDVGPGVPLFDIDGKIILGFDQEEMDRLIGIQE